MRHTLDADYLVVGAGASGLAFTDALVDHADVDVVIVDRRHGPGGHWLDAYPFVRLHQASVFYGVASAELGDGTIQPEGPEAGLHERATAPEICAYYARVMERLQRFGKVTFLFGCDYLGEGRVLSRISRQEYDVRVRRRVVNAHYLEPEIPATTPPPFVAESGTVIPVHRLVSVGEAPGQYVVVGSGKTATDACIWLLGNGVDPDSICWIRPRDPWMLNRAVVQPDPAVFIGMVADTVEAAARATSLDDMFLQLEEAGVMLRIDRSVVPTMARTPTLAQWELDLLRSIENVVRLGHVRRVEKGAVELDEGRVRIAGDAVVVHCAAAGLRDAPPIPIWGSEGITLQPIRSGFPCFGAALAGYVEATRDIDEEKNRLCPATPLPNSLASWARMQVLGYRAAVSFGAEADIREWATGCLLNPARVAPEHRERPEVLAAQRRIGEHAEAGIGRMAGLAAS
jgi:hypothetical protein